MPTRASTAERRKKLKEKEKEVRRLRREDMRATWKEQRVRVTDAAPRLIITVVMLACFIIHSTTQHEKYLEKIELIDRGLMPMALGSDMLLQVGLFVSCIAYTFVHPCTMITVDSIALVLLVAILFVKLPHADYVHAGFLVFVVFIVIAIAVHIYVLFREINRLRRINKNMRQLGGYGRQPSRMKSTYSASFISHESPAHRSIYRDSKVKSIMQSPAKTFAKRMEEEEKKQYEPSNARQAKKKDTSKPSRGRTVRINTGKSVLHAITPPKVSEVSLGPQEEAKKTSDSSVSSGKSKASDTSESSGKSKTSATSISSGKSKTSDTSVISGKSKASETSVSSGKVSSTTGSQLKNAPAKGTQSTAGSAKGTQSRAGSAKGTQPIAGTAKGTQSIAGTRKKSQNPPLKSTSSTTSKEPTDPRRQSTPQTQARRPPSNAQRTASVIKGPRR